MMKRRDFLKYSMLTFAGFLASCKLTGSDLKIANKKPNVIFILTDDQGWGDLASYGHPYVKTPNIDRLAKEGTRFNQFYVNASVCAPSRVAFMSGQFPAKQNVHHIYMTEEFNRKHGVAPYLHPDVPTVGDIMKSKGYTTGHIGKWHLSGRTPQGPDPKELGFDFHKITHSEHIDPDYTKKWRATKHPVTEASHWIMEDGIKFIEKHKNSGKPFYLNLWTLVPHGPLQPSPEELEVYKKLEANPEDFESWMEEYADRARDFKDQMKIFCAALTSLDEAVGKLLDYLDSEGFAEDTLILFTSDNGPEDYHVGDSTNAGVGSPGITRGRKRSLYEGGIRVPCIVRWPGKVKANKLSNAVWSAVDLMPTLASITNASLTNPSELDGEDVSDIWFGAEREHKKDLFWEWKYEIFGNEDDYRPPQLAIRDGQWKLLCNPDGSKAELYKIPNDFAEKNDLALAEPEIASTLKTKLLNWKKSIPEGYSYQD
jgi:N-acetylgalactosamine-6-sulfatase